MNEYGLKKVHADINGEFNIIRKIFKNFHYHVGLKLDFVIFRLVPRYGVKPIYL